MADTIPQIKIIIGSDSEKVEAEVNEFCKKQDVYDLRVHTESNGQHSEFFTSGMLFVATIYWLKVVK